MPFHPGTSMRALRDSYRDDPRLAAVQAALISDRDLVLGGCVGGLVPALISALTVSRPAHWARTVVCGDPAGLLDDLEEFGIAAAHLPELDHFEAVEGDENADRSGHSRRIAALEAFAAGGLLLATPRAVEQPVPDLAEVAKSSIVLRPGEEHAMAALVDRLVATGYRVAAVVEGRGQLAVRGGLIDIYPWIGNDPLRLEFFGDQVEAIRRFDAFTQESVAKVDEAVLATNQGVLATRTLWEQLPAGPLLVVADLPLRGRLAKDHGRREVRLARQLEGDAVDGAGLTVDRLRGDLRRGLSDCRQAAADGEVLILARNDEAKREMEAHCRDHDLAAEVRVGRLSAGWRDQERGLLVVHDFELAEREPVRRRGNRIAGGAPLDSLTDLKRGDHVVHLKHGIGVFRGMATLEKRGFLEDYLVLEFAEESKLYVPVGTIDLVQKYIGTRGEHPELSKIGGATWAKKRARAEKAIEDLAADLLKSQAQRVAAGGIVFPADTPQVRRFETAFPFEETEDQLAAVREIKADMERPVAMDRLLCGDVGFGKTEVAMRAACKAVDAGFQVAVLAPTTLLAEQHFETFSERFTELARSDGTPARIAGLNRFRTGAERREVLELTAAGSVDILIGTHALLTDELKFANLGLLVIDEEHRFGVKHKEKLKAVRHGVDVLSLSATPIPRTLHFSLLGLRDISVLAEAPAQRLAIETRVASWDDKLIAETLAREIDRHGQVFFVHNQVKDIDQIAFKLSRLHQTMTIETVHGQMPEDRIARVMGAYHHGQVQCLVTTSIIESGIDIPNANTLFVNNAHCFGLAELHQIRGRIGRSSRQAHAWFLTPRGVELSPDARARLDAIQEYAELGAGFKLAMRDLELRGAGNLLGSEQSGHIDAIGYELYTKLMHETVGRMKTAAALTELPGAAAAAKSARPLTAAEQGKGAALGLDVDAYIPDTYLETPALKFEVHKHLDSCRRMSDLAALARRTRDRFGPLADPVARLFTVKAIRLRCAELGIARIDVQDRQFRLHLAGALPKELAAVKLPELVHIQLDGSVLVLFVRAAAGQDLALSLLGRLLGIDLGFLGRGT